jgi:hypothetical protein
MVDYFEILGVPQNATIDEIKQAYRRKVSLIHPDVNPSPSAHDDFIQVNQAYEYIVNKKSGKVFDNQQNQYSYQKTAYSEAELLRKARERARENAKMKYADFVNSSYYQSQITFLATVDYLFLGVAILMFLGIISVIIFQYKWNGLISVTILLALIIPALYAATKNVKRLSIKQFVNTVLDIIKIDFISALPLIVFNFITFITIGFSTFLPMKIILGFYLFIPLTLQLCCFFLLWRMDQNKDVLVQKTLRKKFYYRFLLHRPIIKIWGVIPTQFSVFLMLNFYISTNSRTEKYSYTFKSPKADDSWNIIIKDNRFENYWGICYFYNNNQIRQKRFITLKIEEGFCGLDVLKEYSFSLK